MIGSSLSIPIARLLAIFDELYDDSYSKIFVDILLEETDKASVFELLNGLRLSEPKYVLIPRVDRLWEEKRDRFSVGSYETFLIMCSYKPILEVLRCVRSDNPTPGLLWAIYAREYDAAVLELTNKVSTKLRSILDAAVKDHPR